MKLIESDKQPEDEELTEQEAAPTEAEPSAATRNTNGSESRAPLYAALMLVAIGLIVGLVFLARWIYHLIQHHSAKTPITAQSQSKKNTSPSTSSGVIPLGSGRKSSNQTNNKAASGGQTTNKSLPNNGPGNVIGVFAVASFAAGALHYVASLRKTARQN